MDRLAKSGLKCAVLLAAARDFRETVLVTEDDIIKAFEYVEEWRFYEIEVLRNIGKSSTEKILDQTLSMIQRTPNILRSTVMQRLHLTARDADQVFNTLDQRGVIVRTKSGKTERLTAPR
jgi:hypothetical protein